MKKYVTGLFAVVLAISASAFTSGHTILGSYYRDGNTIVPITQNGFCDVGTNFCTYDLIPGREDNGDPANYQGVGTEDKQWVPLP